MSPLLRTLSQLWKTEMAQTDVDIDVSVLFDITNCFSELIMLTKTSADGTNSTGVGFDRRAVLHAALKEGRIFMEQFIKTTKVVPHHLFCIMKSGSPQAIRQSTKVGSEYVEIFAGRL